jgi:hypothetical protein
VEFEDAWLEVRACADGSADDVEGAMLEVPVISEIMGAAAGAGRQPGIWEYSRRLGADEIEAVLKVLRLTKTAEDDRSVSFSVNVTYKGSRYTLTLFAVKRNQ